MSKYRYTLTVEGYGGEHVMGLLSKEQSKFWKEPYTYSFNNQKVKDFKEYMTNHNKEDDKKYIDLKEEHKVKEWHLVDDILHHYCPILNEESSIVVDDDITGDNVIEYKLSEVEIDETINPYSNLLNENFNVLNHLNDEKKIGYGIDFIGDRQVMFGQKLEQGSFSFEQIETDKPFDKYKLKLLVKLFYLGTAHEPKPIKLVYGLLYDGEVSESSGGDTIQKDFNVWIDHTFV